MSAAERRPRVTLLAGGTGGAKLARALAPVCDLAVIANTGDDIEIHGGYVSPDPDLITFHLAGVIDERGWGLDGDTFTVMDELARLGEDVWFRLGDRDLAICIQRAVRLAAGMRLTECQLALCSALGTPPVLPMSDDPVRTRVRTAGRETSLQEFLIRERGARVEGVRFLGADAARPSPEVLKAIALADVLVIGPSNPVISIAPILAVPQIRESLMTRSAPLIAVSPIVGGAVLKGPTEEFMRWAGQPATAAGVAALYAGLIDGVLTDEPAWSGASVPVRTAPTLLDDEPGRRETAEALLEFAGALSE